MQSVGLLNSKVLVLNKLFVALHVINARRAFTLLCKERAEVVSVEDGQFNSYDFGSWCNVSEYRYNKHKGNGKSIHCVKTFSFAIEVPQVIRLLNYDKFPHINIKLNRKSIFARDKNTCQYCYKKFPLSELSLEHVFPKSRGGKNEWTNIVCACKRCNKHKGGRTPKEAGLKLLRDPVIPKYNPIFKLALVSDRLSSWKYFVNDVS